MNRAQQKVLEAHGYMFTSVPGLAEQPKATYYTRDRNTGEVVSMPNLPADPYSLQHYLKKGFTLEPKILKPQAVEVVDTTSQESKKYVCEVCGKGFNLKVALIGHCRSHKTISEGGN